MNSLILVTLIVTLYLSSGIVIAARLFLQETRHPPRLLAMILGTGGILLQAVLLYHNLVTHAGMNFGVFSVLALIAWTIMAILLLSSLTKPVENLGIIIFPTGALVMILEHSFRTVHLLSQPAVWGLKLHILISILAYSLLTLASVQSILLAVQEHHLHTRHPGGFIRTLPPLQTMESLLFEMIGVGFFLLTISLATGFLFLENMFAQHLAHKTILSVCGWLLFGTLLFGRVHSGWRGRTAITWTLVSFTVLMIGYFGSKAVVELILKRGNH